MNKEIIDALLTAMVQSSDGVSDLFFAVGRAPLVEDHGVLQEFPIDSETGMLDDTQLEQLAAFLIGDDKRLQDEFARVGSCDCGYAVGDVARFRVNIFRQRGRT